VLKLETAKVELAKVSEDNATLRKAIENPSVIEKKIYVQGKETIIEKVVVVSSGTTTTTERTIQKDPTTEIVDSNKTPVVPEIHTGTDKKWEKITVLVGYEFEPQDINVGLGYNIRQNLCLGASYSKKSKIGVFSTLRLF
jgi:hypothetical protein